MEKIGAEIEATITGIVFPIEWHGDDVVSIGISTDDEEYVVKLDKVGEELFDFLDEKVKVIGIVKKDQKGNNVFFVIDYEPINDEDYPDEDRDHEYGDYDTEGEIGPNDS